MSSLVTFGKYKGQHVSALYSDKNYIRWLLLQPNFKNHFPEMFKTLIEKLPDFKEISETPVHNRFQMKFLDRFFLQSFLEKVEFMKHGEFPLVEFEEYNFDVLIHYEGCQSYDGLWNHMMQVEIKPVVGDDYPGILRDLHASRAKFEKLTKGYGKLIQVLLVHEFESEAINADQFRQFFEMSKVKVVFFNEIEEFSKQSWSES